MSDPMDDDFEGRPTNAPPEQEAETVMAGPGLQSELRARGTQRAPEDLSGATLGRHSIAHVLGVGGMGVVYEAYDPELDRRVALKVLTSSAASGGTLFARFFSEARVTARLEHSHIVPIYDIANDGEGRVFMTMRKIEGLSLRELLDALRDRDEAMTARWTRLRLLHAFLKVCEAIAYAHSRGVVHRDIKPANVMIGEFGEVLVVDWGIARVRTTQGETEWPRITPTDGAVIGTPGYMSPEQASGQLDAVDERSDLFSLGAILYELLAHAPAYRGATPFDILQQTLQGPPIAPHLRAPELSIPEELSQICMRALAHDREQRFRSVPELSRAIEEFLEGTRRREAADALLARASESWQRYVTLGKEREELLAREKRHADVADAWAPLSERRELMEVRSELASLEPRRAKLFGEVISLCENALANAGDYPPARAALAHAYLSRLAEAEEQRDVPSTVYYADRVQAYDDGQYQTLLAGTGSLTLHTDPPGAEVVCERFDQRGLVFTTIERTVLGRTPLLDVPLPMGSYLLTLKYPGKRDTNYPVHITRARAWSSGERPVPLFSDDEIGASFAYVPHGPFACGGDAEAPGSDPLRSVEVHGFFMARFPVTLEEYVEFLNELHDRDPAEAWRRCPRSESSLREAEGQYLRRPRTGARYTLPEVDPDGNEWDPRWPAFGVSWNDAQAYAQWITAKSGAAHRLALEHEREKAARGADGRFFPWGDGFDRTLCKMGDSRRGRPKPEPVGAFPTDVSIYGVRDLAGSMRDWCGDADFDGDSSLRPVRGGSWNYDPRFCRAACRLGRAPWRVFAYNGFRLVRPLAER
jgi:formylglycine-generating enzyme required for sulfatase activity